MQARWIVVTTAAIMICSACAPPALTGPKPGDVATAAESFDQVIDSYAKLYDREMLSVTGDEKGVRVLPLRGFKLPIGAYRPLKQVDDLSPECYAARDQIRQYELREYPQVDAASVFEANLSLPSTLSKGL